jgi:protein-disulfide isomerase
MRRIGLVGLVFLSWFPVDADAQRRRLDETKLYRVPVGTAPIRGPSRAKVTIIEFSDFQCPFCGRVQPTLDEIRRRYPKDVRIVFRHMPLPSHDDAMRAAQAAVAAAGQGRFWEMHDAMFRNPDQLDQGSLAKTAGQVGLDTARFGRELATAKHAGAVLKDVELGDKLGVTGTPTFFINGRPVKGAMPLEHFTRVIDAELRRADALLAKGVTLDRLYDELVKAGLSEAAKDGGGGGSSGSLDPAATYAVPVGTSPTRGKATAKVTIVEFGDFECPFCSRAQPILDRVRKEYGDDVRLVFKHMPLNFHPDAMSAAEAAAIAGLSGRFWEMHDLLYANQSALAKEDLERYAEAIGLDVVRFRLALDLSRSLTTIVPDLQLAEQLKITGTPTFFVNGRAIVGAQPFETFKKIIDEEKKKAEALLAKGTPPARLYEVLVGLEATATVASDSPPERKRDPSAEADYTMAALLHCEQGDETAARRAWQKLKGSRRQMVAKDCKGLGVDLTKK